MKPQYVHLRVHLNDSMFRFFIIVQHSSPAANLLEALSPVFTADTWGKDIVSFHHFLSLHYLISFQELKRIFLLFRFSFWIENWFKYRDSITICIFTFVSNLQCHSISLLVIKINCTFHIWIRYSYFFLPNVIIIHFFVKTICI